MIEHELRIDAHGNRLSGTVCRPVEPGALPVVLMIHGTGPLDRDENMSGQRLDVFNTIARRLAASGIASVRYDKRGCGRSTGNYLSAGQTDLLADAIAWIDALSTQSFCTGRSIFLLGHSEGCLIGPRASLERPHVAGLLLLCPTLAPIETVLMRQAAHIEREIDAMPAFRGSIYRLLVKLLGRPTRRQRRLIDRVVSTESTTLRVGLQPIAVKSLRELLALDARAIFEQVRCPMLLIGGAKDLQCDPADVAAIASLSDRAEAHIVPDLTHILRRDDRPPSFFGYAQLLRAPVDPKVLELIESWLKRHSC